MSHVGALLLFVVVIMKMRVVVDRSSSRSPGAVDFSAAVRRVDCALLGDAAQWTNLLRLLIGDVLHIVNGSRNISAIFPVAKSTGDVTVHDGDPIVIVPIHDVIGVAQELFCRTRLVLDASAEKPTEFVLP